MSYYDEDGNLITGDCELPVLPNPAPREVSVEIKDGETDNKAIVDEEGNLQVKVTSMPDITIDTTNLSVEISNDAGNPIPVEIQNQTPIPIFVNDDTDTIPVTVVSQVDVRILETDNIVRVSGEQFVRNVPIYNEETEEFEPLPITVEISNPVTEVSVSNFPDFPTTIEVSNIPEVQEVSGTIFVDDTTPIEVNIKNESLSVAVSNLSEIVPPTDIKINNGPEDAIPVTGTVTATVEFPATQAISGSVTVSNFSEITPPSEIMVNNEDTDPIPVKLIDSGTLSNEVNQYFEQRYSLYNDNATMYADCAAPQPDPFGRDGFYYINDGVTGTSHIDALPIPQSQKDTNKKKINWYFYDPARIVAPYSALKNTWALVTVDKSKAPFFFVYSTVNGQTIANRWVFSSYTETLKPGTTYLFWFGTEEPTVFPDVPRIQLSFNLASSTGPINPAQIILSIAYTTNSGDAVNSVQLQTYALGYNVNNTEQSVKLAIKKSESVVVSGEVTINSATPVNVTVSNPVSSVDVSTLPEITIADNQSVTITNTSFDIGNLADITPPTEIKVNNSASEPVPITGSVTASVEFPATQTISGSVTVSNFSEITPPTEIKINNGPTEAVPVTGSVEVSNTVAVSGQVTIDSTTPVNITVSNPITSVDVSSLPEIMIADDQSVTITNTSFEVSNLADVPIATEIKINNAPADAIPVTGTVTANVEFPATQTISGSVTVSNLADVTPPTEIKVNNTASEPVPVTINNADPVSVTVSNPVDSVTVSGTVNVGNTDPISVTVSNPIDTVTVSGTVNIGNTDPIAISGSVDAAVTGSVTVNNTENIPVTVSNPVTDVTISNAIDINSLPNVNATIINQDPLSVTVTNDIVVSPPDNQNVTIINENPVLVSASVTALPDVKLDATGNIIKIDQTTPGANHIHLADKTNPNHVAKVSSNGSVHAVITNDTESAIPVDINNITLYDHPNYGVIPYVATTNVYDIDAGANIPLDVTGTVEINGGAVIAYGAQFDTIVGESVDLYENPANPGEYSLDGSLNWDIAATGDVASELYKSVKISNADEWFWPTGSSDRVTWLLNRDRSPEEYGAIPLPAKPIETKIAQSSPGATPESPLYIAIVGSIDAGTWV